MSEVLAVKFVRRTFGKSYDEWFAARTPATRVQFLGLLLLGATIVASGLTVLALIWSKAFSDPLLGGFVIAISSICSIPALVVVYFGVLHIKRALARRN
jgi:hypothetical protein